GAVYAEAPQSVPVPWPKPWSAGKGDIVKGYRGNIEEAAVQNNDYRRVLYTGAHQQLVLMSLEPGDEIGNEVHDVDQFIRVEAGTGSAIINNTDEQAVSDGWARLVPAGTWHNIVNTGSEPLKL